MVAMQRDAGQDTASKGERGGQRLSSQLIAILREQPVFDDFESCKREKLALEKIQENGRDVSRVRSFIHHTNLAG